MPDRHPPTKTRRETVPGTVNAQQAYAALATIALTIASLLCYFDRLGAVDVGRGVYAIAIGLFAVGGHGWSVSRAESRVRREIGGKVAELTTVLAELRDEVTRQRTVYLPAAAKQVDSTVPAPRTPAVNPEELREEVERVVAEEMGTRESVRAQGYAEGYVDGIDRRRDDGVPPAG